MYVYTIYIYFFYFIKYTEKYILDLMNPKIYYLLNNK